MIKIRLSRGGAKKAPYWHIVAIDESKKRDGAPLEILGHWHPAKGDIQIDRKKIEGWITKGAVVTKAVEKLIK